MNNTQLFAFSNVHLKLYNKKNKRLIKEIHKKNTITKYTLNGIASMLKGEFNDTNYIQINRYVPKYLALGTNMPTDNTGITTKNIVTVNDDSLYGEILKNGKPNRIRLEQARRVDNVTTNEFVKIRFRTMVMAGVVSYNTVIQELGLFVDNTDIKGGLFARIATEPITIPENSVLDVQWDIVLTSSTGVYPTSVYLLDDNNKIISNGSVNLNYNQVLPITANLESSVVDLNNSTQVEAEYTPHIDSMTWITDGNVTTAQTTNNFNKTVMFVDIVKNSADNYEIYSYNSLNLNKVYQTIEDTLDGAKEYVITNGLLLAVDINGNIVREGSNANKYNYKDVTYTNCVWNFYDNGTLIEEYKSSNTYQETEFVTYNNSIYRCTSNNTTGEWDDSKWVKIISYIKYMVNIVLIGMSDVSCEIELEVVTSTNIKSRTTIMFNGGNQ